MFSALNVQNPPHATPKKITAKSIFTIFLPFLTFEIKATKSETAETAKITENVFITTWLLSVPVVLILALMPHIRL